MSAASSNRAKQISGAAESLYKARRSGPPIPPVSETHGIVDPEVAYAVQEENTHRWLNEGRRLVGRKAGLTSKVVQRQFGLDEPDYGMLWGDDAYEDGAEVPVGRFLQPRVEAEIAFVMKRRVDSPDTTLTDLIGSVGFGLAALEIVDSAIADWKITLADTIADNASGGGFLLGNAPREVTNMDLRLCGMVLSKNGEHASLGVGAACLGNPLNALLWLARKMAVKGRPLAEGDIVLSGALGPMISVEAGDRIDVEIQGFAPLHLSFCGDA